MRTYQDGTTVGGVVLGLLGCLGCLEWYEPSMYTYQEKCVPPPGWAAGGGNQ